MKDSRSAAETRNLSARPFEVRGVDAEEEGLKAAGRAGGSRGEQQPPAQPCLAHGQPHHVIPLGCEIQMQN